MCGICGIVIKKGNTSSLDVMEKRLRAMMGALEHRGPDDSGNFVDRNNGVLLGHKRLSIIDLSSAGKQPFISEDGMIVTVCNGEIYNYKEIREQLKERRHRFLSDSDNEVILHLFEEKGSAAWDDLRGMYAVAAYEKGSGNLFLTRDPLGIKPLYIYENSQFFAFSSEVKTFYVLGFDLEPNIDGFVDFLMLGHIPAPRTYLNHVRALLPGQTARINGDEILLSGEGPIPDWCMHVKESNRCDVAGLRECICDSVSRHLVSDAPIGVFLSGGIDSGILTGVASEVSAADLRTITVTLPGEPLDESSYACRVAQSYGAKHTEVPLTQKDFEKDVSLFLSCLDMPSIDGFNSFFVSKTAREAGLTVALSGLGGDELFCGYPTFGWIPLFARTQAALGFVGGNMGRKLGSVVLSRLYGGSAAARVGELLTKYPGDPRIGYLAYRGLFVGRFLEDVLGPDLACKAEESFDRYMEETSWVTQKGMSSLMAVAGLELSRYMCYQLLRDMDAVSMAHSMEIRVPLVDREVIRKALGLIDCKNQGDGYPKWWLRQSVKKSLPQDVVKRRKQGFVFPWQKWLKGEVLRQMENKLNEKDNWVCFLKKEGVRKWQNAYKTGWSHWSCLWGLYIAITFLSKDEHSLCKTYSDK